MIELLVASVVTMNENIQKIRREGSNTHILHQSFTCVGTDNPLKITDCKINQALILTLFHWITLILIE